MPMFYFTAVKNKSTVVTWYDIPAYNSCLPGIQPIIADNSESSKSKTGKHVFRKMGLALDYQCVGNILVEVWNVNALYVIITSEFLLWFCEI